MRRLGVNDPLGFLSSSCLQVDLKNSASKYDIPKAQVGRQVVPLDA